MHELQAAPPLPNPGVTLFLFAVNEDPHTRNRPRPRTDLPGSVRLRKPDITLELRYLITAWSDDHDLRQAMLERTVQTFYDEAILSGPQLVGDLSGTDSELKISLDQLSLEDRTRVWNSLNRPFKLSLIYTVRVVNVPASSEEQFTPVSRRTLRVGTPEVTV